MRKSEAVSGPSRLVGELAGMGTHLTSWPLGPLPPVLHHLRPGGCLETRALQLWPGGGLRPAGRPQPARRCHLRTCAAWHMGNWSKVRRRRLAALRAQGGAPGPMACVWDQPQPPPIGGLVRAYSFAL